jgi:hypothetical protein
MRKQLAVLMAVALVGSAFAAPAGAAQKKKKKAPACKAYQPGDMGAEAETTKITDKATEESPVEITVTQAAALGATNNHVAHNVQVDSKAKEAGLYVRYEFPAYEDHDLYVYYPDGKEAASVGGFNPTPAGPFDGTGSGGHSEQGAEQIDGLRTGDCVGYTLDLVNYLGSGGDYTVTAWLGEIQNDPKG